MPAMSTVILLSSSPPRPFARPPTPVVVSTSPPLPSPNAIFSGGSDGYKKFKRAAVQTDGFSAGFTSARTLLTPRIGAENLPLGDRVNKSKDADCGDKSTVAERPMKNRIKRATESEDSVQGQHRHSAVPLQKQARRTVKTGEESRLEVAVGELPTVSHISERSNPGLNSPLFLEKTILRRGDWTPPKPAEMLPVSLDSPMSPTNFFGGNLLGDFGYVSNTSMVTGATKDGTDPPTKRRRIDFVATGINKSSENVSTETPQAGEREKSTGLKLKRTKSQAKKPLTITGLATARYSLSTNVEKPIPTMQCLSTSQIQDGKTTQDKAKNPVKSKRAPKKSRAKKVSDPRFTVLCPESAMKALDSQEILFGSASQLAREESPTFTRDTLEALKRSESGLMSDPISTQTTQPISIESTTPKIARGTTRFRKAKGLWSAAGRDEDNALMQVESVDLLDTPDIRRAFAGKDVLLDLEAPRYRDKTLSQQKSHHLHGFHHPGSSVRPSMCYDIDDIVTPIVLSRRMNLNTVQKMSLHTLSNVAASPMAPPTLKSQSLLPSISEPLNPEDRIKIPDTSSQNQEGPSKNQPKPVKPSYAGFSIHDLQKQISAYGFKPIKKREKMIELLEKCWEDKQKMAGNSKAGEETPQKQEIEGPTHGAILTRLHDLSSRTTPKIVKPKAKAKKKAEREAVDTPKRRSTAKSKHFEPKARKSQGSGAEKAPRKRKSKVSVLSEERIVDIDEIEESGIEIAKLPANSSSAARLALGGELGIDDIALHEQHTSALNAPDSLVARPSNPESPHTTSQPGQESSDSPVSLPDMHRQIRRAITTFVPEPGRDHRVNPTWHEKILLYDPIDLQDLTGWLNTEGLARIHEDREVSALEVRAWCEMEGVCCLWKGGWRGKGRGGGGGEGGKEWDG